MKPSDPGICFRPLMADGVEWSGVSHCRGCRRGYRPERARGSDVGKCGCAIRTTPRHTALLADRASDIRLGIGGGGSGSGASAISDLTDRKVVQ